MKVAFGFKAHSGWAALVLVGLNNGSFEVLDRRRIELAREEWAKQPYHAAEELEASEARKIVERGIRDAHKYALREMQAAVKREETNGHRVVGCGVLMGAAMPEWIVDEILAVHFRMHKAEGVLFREALAQAATSCNIRLARIPEKTLINFAAKTLRRTEAELVNEIGVLGKRAGPPWGKDQKEAALAAMIALCHLSDEH
jgi:hypothetical protein